MVQKAKARKKPPKHFSPETWITIQTLFESGRFSSLSDLHKHYTKILPESQRPSLDSLKRKAASLQWDKTKQNEIIEEKKAKNFSELFSELGLTEHKMAEVMVNGVLCAEQMRNTIIEQFKTNGTEILSDPLQSKVMYDNLNSLFSDMRTAHKYLETCLRLSGANPSEKKTVTLKDSGDVVAKLTRNFDEWSDDELDKEINRLKKIQDVR
jgi:hypothetical protein